MRTYEFECVGCHNVVDVDISKLDDVPDVVVICTHDGCPMYKIETTNRDEE